MATPRQRSALTAAVRLSPRDVQRTRFILGPPRAPMTVGSDVRVQRVTYQAYLLAPPERRFIRDIEGIGREYFVAYVDEAKRNGGTK